MFCALSEANGYKYESEKAYDLIMEKLDKWEQIYNVYLPFNCGLR